jgi:hypothetical protein
MSRTMMTGRRLLAPLFALPLLAVAPAPAGRDCAPARMGWDASQLRLDIQRSGGSETLLVEGRIGTDLPARLEAVLAAHPDIATIHFNASGEDRNSAMAAGLVLRAAGNFEAHVPAGANCTDACALLFLSGRIRSVDPAAVFDLGPFYEPAQVPARSAEIARQSLDVSNYLIRMGVSRRLLTGTLDRDAASAADGTNRCLTPEELRGYNVANWNE